MRVFCHRERGKTRGNPLTHPEALRILHPNWWILAFFGGC